MNYKWVNPNIVIANLEFTYKIKTPEYINLLPLWITNYLKGLNINLPFEPHYAKREVVNNIMTLPNDLSVLSTITIDDTIIKRTDKNMLKSVKSSTYNDVLVMYQLAGTETTTDDEGNVISIKSVPIDAYNHSTTPIEYILHNNGIVEFNYSDGSTITEPFEVEIYYFRIPSMIDELTGIRVPMIPDSRKLIENLTWYVLMNLLYSGYKHPILNLQSAMPYVNPAKMYEDGLAAARNSLMTWDSEKHELISNVLNAFVHNIDWSSRNFNS